MPKKFYNIGLSFTRKPPRSKHDSSGFQPDAEVHFPSQDAASRVLIGTLMLNNGNGSAGNNVVAGNHHSKAPQNRPFQMMNMIHNSSMEQPYSFSQTKQVIKTPLCLFLFAKENWIFLPPTNTEDLVVLMMFLSMGHPRPLFHFLFYFVLLLFQHQWPIL